MTEINSNDKTLKPLEGQISLLTQEELKAMERGDDHVPKNNSN